MKEKVYEFLKTKGLSEEITYFEESTESAAEAAEALKCDPGAIAKTIVLDHGKKPLIVVVSGKEKINTDLYKRRFARRFSMMTAERMQEATGYIPGGASPFLLPENTAVFIDESLFAYDYVYPAAGSSNSTVKLSLDDLFELSGAKSGINLTCDQMQNYKILYRYLPETEISGWSAGMTNELAIFPADADYAERDFALRLSSATVDAKESVFSDLSGCERYITPLEHEMSLSFEADEEKYLKSDEHALEQAERCDGEIKVALKTYETLKFRGEAKVDCRARGRDFNLIYKREGEKAFGEFSGLKKRKRFDKRFKNYALCVFLYNHDQEESEIKFNYHPLIIPPKTLALISDDEEVFENLKPQSRDETTADVKDAIAEFEAIGKGGVDIVKECKKDLIVGGIYIKKSDDSHD